MNAWSNISVSPQDPEIIKINELETKLGKLPDHVYKVRELITRHEVCHFKFRHHIRKIKDSIINLEPEVAPDKIGINHIQHGEDAWKRDSTGRSLLGQQYVWAIKVWLKDIPPAEIPDKYDNKLGQKVQKWPDGSNVDKIRLVRLLLARLMWDWKSYEELQQGGELKDLEFQICRMDICHYAFPSNLERVLQGIGEVKPTGNFEGCGSYNSDIKEFVEKELLSLNDLFKSLYNNGKSDERDQTRAWLVASLMKTLKKQVETSEPLVRI